MPLYEFTYTDGKAIGSGTVDASDKESAEKKLRAELKDATDSKKLKIEIGKETKPHKISISVKESK
jgi:hypothetical protein